MKDFARLLPVACLCLGACSEAEAPPGEAEARLQFSVAGRLENKKIDEASGLARSQREPGVLWTINDSGKNSRQK